MTAGAWNPRMKTITRYVLFPLVAVWFFGLAEARAAVPMRIDIKSVTIERNAIWTASLIKIKALDDAGVEVNYSGLANYILPNLYDCRPCNMPTSFDTNAFNGFQLDFGQDRHAAFALLEGQADPLTVPATVLRKPQTFFRVGQASFKAKFTYRETNGDVITYDDDVELVGTYSAEFGHVPVFDGRRISFHRIFFDLRVPSN